MVFEKDDVLRKEKRIKIAKENSWELRFKGISEIIREEIVSLEKQPIEINWKDRFNSYFNLRSKRRKLVFTTMFGLLIIFYSPLFWFMGEQLIARDLLKKSDAIVVFSGDGEVSYQNLSYQNRALDAVRLYKEGYADKIFLSSGREQTIADVEMIKLYLVSKGVPESLIYTLDSYPNSTYENVKMVGEDLVKNNIGSFVFLTAPYHSRRAVMIWRKNVKNIKVIPSNILKPKHKQAYYVSFDDMRIIAYEYAAIVHNWLLGRI